VAALLVTLLLAMPAESRAEQLPVKVYKSTDGLAHDRVRRVVCDSRGFLWVCTLEGLSRFDGYGFTNYTSRQGLPHDTVNALLETRAGEYWVATEGGLCKFNSTSNSYRAAGRESLPAKGESESRFTPYTLGDSGRVCRVFTLLEDRSGIIWAGAEGGLFFLDPKSGGASFERFVINSPSLREAELRITAIAEDSERSLWIFSSPFIIRRLPDGRVVHYGDQTAGHTLMLDRDDRLWVGSFWNLTVIKPTPAREAAPGDSTPWSVLRDQTKEANRPGGQFTPPVAAGQAATVVTDERLAGSSFGLSRSTIVSICQAGGGRVWLAQLSVSKGGAGLT
jgi:ligand-binding sensor domain-containing protein